MPLREDRLLNYPRHLDYYLESQDEDKFIPLDHGEYVPNVCAIKWPRIVINSVALRVIQTEKQRGAHGITFSSRDRSIVVNIKPVEILMDRYGLKLSEAIIACASMCPNCLHDLMRAEGLGAYVAYDPKASCFFCLPTEGMEQTRSSPS